ncbi:MAG: hypothetical protein CVT63_07080 [Candidatus Anoxymicrobium japonicum]|uniref:HNH endonuclease n=1 Tax=Candidatus Anoxymicrobium japonicum TaxID=2013648 RepID=A0A2N3G4V9_9ACTN|nr:MAG: hypothetical protein CVT63_07080 [Candidatus Anoxymicrobium japonicum]
MTLLHRRQPAPRHDDFRLYKVYLREDFVYRCVYCTVHESEWGGFRHFQVEHFRPKVHFPKLLTEYSNLLYACDVCNAFKGDDWPSDQPLTDRVGYLDPCEHDYDLYFVVADDYRLLPMTPVASYMVERLHLNRNQLRKVREKRAREETLHNQYIQLIDDTLTMMQTALCDLAVPAHARQSLEMALAMWRSEREAHLLAWAKRWDPPYNSGDYR